MKSTFRCKCTLPLLISALIVFSVSCSTDSARFETADTPKDRVLQGLMTIDGSRVRTDRTYRLEDRMAHHRVPGVSIAVIQDYKLDWAEGIGVLEQGSSDPVTIETVFQPASIGKTLTAVAVMVNVQEGNLGLDQDVNRYLRLWKLPANKLTNRSPVTLRHLLSHTAGATVASFAGYDHNAPLPSLVQILDGQQPANSDPVRIITEPGTAYQYSGGGFQIVQQVLKDIEKASFPAVLKRTVFDPLEMRRTVADLPPPQNLIKGAARGHNVSGEPLPGGWRVHPEMGAGASLWSTPSDLAVFTTDILRAWKGLSSMILTQENARMMLTPQHGPAALGFGVIGQRQATHIMHEGQNQGYTGILIGFPETGQGAIILTNSDGGQPLYYELLFSIAKEYGWPGAALQITVENTHGDPIPGAIVRIASGPNGQQPIQGKTDKDGSVELRDLLSGNYTLEATLNGAVIGTAKAVALTNIVEPIVLKADVR